MSESYDAIRLETPGGTVVCWFAPSFEVVPQDQNNVHEAPKTNGPAIVRNNTLWTSECVVQGTFVHSENTKEPFTSALQNLHGKQTVTPDDQIDRLRAFTVYGTTGGFHFYHRDREYTAMSSDDVDVVNSVYPAVVVSELRLPENAETSTTRTDFTVRMSVGIPREGDPEEEEPDI